MHRCGRVCLHTCASRCAAQRAGPKVQGAGWRGPRVAFDTEGRIIGYHPRTGKYTGMLGSFECQLLKGSKKKFFISGVTDEVRENYRRTHPIGTVVRILYNDTLKDGVPRHPRYFRKREDYGF